MIRLRRVLVEEQVMQLQMQRAKGMVGAGGPVGQVPDPSITHRRRSASVVEQRGVRAEAFLAHQLLGVQGAIGLPKLGMTLGRDIPNAAVEGHICRVTPTITTAPPPLLSTNRRGASLQQWSPRRCCSTAGSTTPPCFLPATRRSTRRLVLTCVTDAPGSPH